MLFVLLSVEMIWWDS